MINKREAHKLRGLVSRIVHTTKAAAYAGAATPEDAVQLRADEQKAKKAFYDYVKQLQLPFWI